MPDPANFLPSRDGFRFANTWAAGAPVELAGLTWGRVTGGLCGGMCVAARRRFLAGRPPPDDETAPTAGPLYEEVWRAQLESLELPGGPLRYLRLQWPWTSTSARRRSTLGRALPAVRSALAAGRPQPLGLVRAVGADPRLLARHHVVLAYDLATSPDRIEIAVYDPNQPRADDVRLVLTEPGDVTASRGIGPVHALLPVR